MGRTFNYILLVGRDPRFGIALGPNGSKVLYVLTYSPYLTSVCIILDSDPAPSPTHGSNSSRLVGDEKGFENPFGARDLRELEIIKQHNC